MTFNICTTGIFQTLVSLAQGQNEWYDADDRSFDSRHRKKTGGNLRKGCKCNWEKRLSLNKKNRKKCENEIWRCITIKKNMPSKSKVKY